MRVLPPGNRKDKTALIGQIAFLVATLKKISLLLLLQKKLRFI